MKDIKRIVGNNLLLLISFVILVRVFGITPRENLDESNQQYGNLGPLISTALFIIIQVVFNLGKSIYWFFNKNKNLGGVYLLSSFLVLLIGFSSCVTILNI